MIAFFIFSPEFFRELSGFCNNGGAHGRDGIPTHTHAHIHNTGDSRQRVLIPKKTGQRYNMMTRVLLDH